MSNPIDARARDLRIEHHPRGRQVLGIGEAEPRLSWQVGLAPPGWRQSAYEIELARGVSLRTATVESTEQVLVPWPFEALISRESVAVRVRVRDAEGTWSLWSDPVEVEAGLLAPTDWTARMIAPTSIARAGSPAPILRGSLAVRELPVSARAYVTAHGVYALRINGHAAGDVLGPGWTSYQHRLRYHTYDIASMLRTGENSVEILVGDGWFRGRLGWEGSSGIYGDHLGALLQVELQEPGGELVTWGTDSTWTAHESQVTQHDHYNGEHWDFRRARVGQEDSVRIVDVDAATLVAPDGPPVRVVEVLPATRVWRSPSGRQLVDFGQNLVGRARIRSAGMAPGSVITVRHAEVLEGGELCTRPLRTAEATNVFRIGDVTPDVLEPQLTFQGFRYIEVSGFEHLTASDVEAAVLSSDLERTGWFDSSHALLNQFHDNVFWGMRGNFLDVPTDCPQRDERLGWTGDIQVFAPTAQFLADSTGFLVSWLKDLACDQNSDGSVPFVIPDCLRMPSPVAAAWGDAAVLVPWTVYQRSGDLDVLRRQLPSMRAWVDLVASRTAPSGAWIGGFQFGDWLDPDAPPEDPGRAKTPQDVVATAYLARSAHVLSLACALLGDDEGSERYGHVAARARSGFVHEFVTASGRVLGDAATGYALALEFDLLPADLRAPAAHRLADLVRCANLRITTGFVGTPLITDALANNGFPGLAVRLLLQTECPSWLYSVTMGATTVWERWDSMLPDGTVNPGGMTSFNHYALGAVADWMHRRLAGLAPAAPGYARISVEPLLTAMLDHASATHITPYGTASAGWVREGGVVELRLEIPIGVIADVQVAGLEEVTVGHGLHVWRFEEQLETPSSPATVRDVLDDHLLWEGVVEAAVDTGLAQDGLDVARRLEHVLDEPTTALADGILKGVPMPREAELRSRLAGLLG